MGAVLAGVLADYEAYLRRVDPITAGMEGDREALSRLPFTGVKGDAQALRASARACLRLMEDHMVKQGIRGCGFFAGPAATPVADQ